MVGVVSALVPSETAQAAEAAELAQARGVIVADVAAYTQREEALTAAVVVRAVMMMSIMMVVMMVMLVLLYNYYLLLRGRLLVIYGLLWLLVGRRCGWKGLVVVPLRLLSSVGVFLSRIHFCSLAVLYLIYNVFIVK